MYVERHQISRAPLPPPGLGDLGQWGEIAQAIGSVGGIFAKLFGGKKKTKPRRYAAGFAFKRPPTMKDILDALKATVISTSAEKGITCNTQDVNPNINGVIVIGSGGWKGHAAETAGLIAPGTQTANEMARSIEQQLNQVPEPYRSQILNTPAPIQPREVPMTLGVGTCPPGRNTFWTQNGYTFYAIADGPSSLDQLFTRVGSMFSQIVNQVFASIPQQPTQPSQPSQPSQPAQPTGVSTTLPPPVAVPVSPGPGGTLVPAPAPIYTTGPAIPPSYLQPSPEVPISQTTATVGGFSPGMLAVLAAGGLLLLAAPGREPKRRKRRRPPAGTTVIRRY